MRETIGGIDNWSWTDFLFKKQMFRMKKMFVYNIYTDYSSSLFNCVVPVTVIKK